MMNPVSASSNIGVSAYQSSNGLSGEALMTYISARLNSFDSEINSYLSEQNDTLRDKENLQHVKNFVGKVKAAKEGANISDQELKESKAELMKELEDDPALQAEVNEMFEGSPPPPDPSAEGTKPAGRGRGGAEDQNEYKGRTNTGGGAPSPDAELPSGSVVAGQPSREHELKWADDFGQHSKEALTVKLDEIDTRISQLGANSELKMIRIQQLMSQRQTAVQLTTNISSKYNQGDESIIGNIR